MINPDTTEVDLSCFKIEVIQKEAYIRGKRRTLKTQILTSKPNKAQFNISLRANVVHTLDATLARDYVLNTNMWCVHDCFSIDFLNITFEVALVNELMNQSSHNIEIAGKRKRRIFGLFLIR
jgi:hypothetical protein